ncbi:hypothetical protein BX666DRAFT_930209 [Dichotomocladium elegans]|nr:hypothetical protein BX666DRAFT_930209 [Dichotomocladium elegans]
MQLHLHGHSGCRSNMKLSFLFWQELQFFTVIRQFCNALDLPQVQHAAIDLYNRQRNDIKRYTDHSAAALVYLVAKVHRPHLLLADVCDKLRLPLDKTNALVQRLKQRSLENNASSMPDFPKYDVKDQVEVVYSKIISILLAVFWGTQDLTTSKEAQQRIRSLTVQILNVIKRSGMELGRHSRPIVAAAMVFSARCLSNQHHRLCVNELEGIAAALNYNKRTLLQRYREIGNLFANRAKLVPWAATDETFRLPGKHGVNQKEIAYEQIIQLMGEDTNTFLEWKKPANNSQPSLEHHPPSFVREHQKTQARVQVVNAVQNILVQGDHGLPEDANMEMRVIYLLLKNRVPPEELYILDESQLLQRFIRLQQQRHLEHDLDQPQLCDQDLSEEEAKLYLR